MKRMTGRILAVLLAFTGAACSSPPIGAGNLKAEAGAKGFLARASIGDKVVADAQGRGAFRPVIMDCFQPTAPQEGPLPAAIGKTIPAETSVVKTSTSGGALVQTVSATGGPVEGRFAISISPSSKHTDGLAVKCEVELKGDGLVAAVGLSLPIVMGEDLFWRKTTVGGGNPQRPSETWRVDQNRGQRGWPKWQLGGLAVDGPGHYLTWKASQRDTPLLPMDQGESCPGWLDYSERDWGVTVLWEDMASHAPAGIWMEADAGVLTVYLRPPSATPLRVTGKAELAATFELAFHEGPYPVTFRPELSREKYKELLDAMAEGGRGSLLGTALRAFNCRDADELIDSGIQPSLAMSVEGQAGRRMKALCAKLGVPFDDRRAQDKPKEYGQDLIRQIVAKFGGQTSFRF